MKVTDPRPGPRPHPRPELRPATLAVAAGRPAASPNAPLNHPVTFAATYIARAHSAESDDLGYGRWANPSWTAFEQALGALEGGPALLFGSGMAAIAAVLAQLRPGGLVVVPDGAYSGTRALLHHLAVSGAVVVRPVPIADTDAVLAALGGSQPADLLWLESPTNPLLEVADLPALIGAGRRAGAVVAVDNTFPTPLGQRPLEIGADVVVHSVTKYLSGHSDLVLGAVVSADRGTGAGGGPLHGALHGHRTVHGAVPGPMEAALALRGLRTLHLRLERAAANAGELARRLAEHPRVARVRYPGLPGDPGHARAAAQLNTFGAIVSIEVAAEEDSAALAEAVCAGTRLWAHSTSLGGVESTLERRRRHAEEPEAVPPNLLRLSVGIEDVEDLWEDLDQALVAAPGRVRG